MSTEPSRYSNVSIEVVHAGVCASCHARTTYVFTYLRDAFSDTFRPMCRDCGLIMLRHAIDGLDISEQLRGLFG